jgi:exosortase
MAGLAVLIAGLGILVLGTLGAELFLTRVSLILVLAGTILFVWGADHLRALAFPLGFLLFMIPLPTVLFDHLAVSLQLVASGIGAEVLRAADVPVLRDGNILRLAGITLQVNDACSGIRSLHALAALTLCLGYRRGGSRWRRCGAALIAIPVAVLFNGLRIGVSGIAASHLGSWAAEGMFHETVGWLVFVAAAGCTWMLQRVAPPAYSWRSAPAS